MDDLTGSLLHACARYISYVYFGDQNDSLNDHTLSDEIVIAKGDDEDVCDKEYSHFEYSVKFVCVGYVIVITVE